MDFAEIKKLFKQLFDNLSENIEATPERFSRWWDSVNVLEMLSFSTSLILLCVVLIVAAIAKITDNIPKAEKEANTNQSSPAPANRSTSGNTMSSANNNSNSNASFNGYSYNSNNGTILLTNRTENVNK